MSTNDGKHLLFTRVSFDQYGKLKMNLPVVTKYSSDGVVGVAEINMKWNHGGIVDYSWSYQTKKYWYPLVHGSFCYFNADFLLNKSVDDVILQHLNAKMYASSTNKCDVIFSSKVAILKELHLTFNIKIRDEAPTPSPSEDDDEEVEEKTLEQNHWKRPKLYVLASFIQ